MSEVEAKTRARIMIGRNDPPPNDRAGQRALEKIVRAIVAAMPGYTVRVSDPIRPPESDP